MPTLTEEIVHEVQTRAAGLTPPPVTASVAISLGYTCVELKNGSLGVCYTPRSTSASCAHYHRAGSLTDMNIYDLMGLMLSRSPLERSVGVAAVNAVSQSLMALDPERYCLEERDFLGFLPFGDDPVRIGMVGNIGPFVSYLSERAEQLIIIDDNPFVTSGAHSHNCIISRDINDLSDADLLIITGSAAAVGDFDEVLGAAEQARFIGVIGPSAGWIPDPAFRRGVHAVAGTRITDTHRARRVILEGGGTHHFMPYGIKYTLTPVAPHPDRTPSLLP